MRICGMVFVVALACAPGVGLAETYLCKGVDPVWKLTMDNTSAEFDLRGKIGKFRVELTTVAKGRDAPSARSLVGDFDTAIVILNDHMCEDGISTSVSILTQDDTAAILLAGCCVLGN